MKRCHSSPVANDIPSLNAKMLCCGQQMHVMGTHDSESTLDRRGQVNGVSGP